MRRAGLAKQAIRRRHQSTLSGLGILGIRREDKNRWERRAPLAPIHVKQLVREGVRVVVQPSNVRIATDHEYSEAGAEISEDLSPCNVILGVKEVPVSKLLPDRTYMFFSHTIKAQEYNMPLLDACLAKNIQLMDYERIIAAEGNRLVKFGKFAGYAGMIDMFHGLGDRLLAMGFSTPFLHVGFTRMYSGLPAAEEAVKIIGEQIAQGGLPRELGPMVFAFTGNGSVGRGAQQIFSLLPHKMVKPSELRELVLNKSFDNHIVYGVICTSKDLVTPIDPNQPFDRKHYFNNPRQYRSIFAETIAPYASVIVNGIYWAEGFPRLLTVEQLEKMHKKRQSRLIAVADLSCDVDGSIEFMRQTSSIDHPFYIWDIDKREINWDTINGQGVMLLAVDNLPTEVPVDATQYFGDSLLPWIEPLVKNDATLPIEQQSLPLPLKTAVITAHGELAPNHRYIAALREERAKVKKVVASKKILVLGSGLVSPPAIEYLARFRDNAITVASANVSEAESRIGTFKNAKAVELDVNNESDLAGLVAAHDIVVSLLPAPFHVKVAKKCIEHGVHMITTSYVSPEMAQLHDKAVAAGITILNEVGLDPGLDHLTAMKVIRECHDRGGVVTKFTSWCGGLPAPEASSNPMGYKFSWAPRGALLAGLNGALYIDQGEVVELPKGSAFKAAEPVTYWPGFNLEGYPNRDSVSYAKDYGISGSAKKFFRGTLRFKGFSKIFDALVRLGFVNVEPLEQLQPGAAPVTWRELALLLQPDLTTYDLEVGSIRKLGIEGEEAAKVEEALDWLGVFGSDRVPQKGTVLDSLCDRMLSKMSYAKGERDLVILRHEFEMVIGGKERRMSSSMVRYGDPDGHSAMALTVGMPAGIATKLVLDGQIIRRGVLRPLTPDIYAPLLAYLEDEGICMVEKYY